ncbi:MAG: STAS/SEC14 domain-containing protein [Acidobacteriia bacterium]|nr:STAS/SEC14 domain-containing protein [Terriglobia bacterium]
MEERIRFITYKNKQILLADCSHCTAAEVEKISQLLPSYVTAEPLGSVLLLADFTGADIKRDTVTEIKKDAVFNRPHLKRSAWVGTEAIPQVFYEHIKSFSQRDLPAFKTREEAMDWLVKD